MRFLISAILSLSPFVGSMAQGEPTNLLLVNSTKKNVVLSVELPDQTVSFVIDAEHSFTSLLRPTKDDRVIIARLAGTGGQLFSSPCKVLTTGSFNASSAAGDTFAAVLAGDDTGGYDIVYWLRDGDKLTKPILETPEKHKLYEKHKEAIQRALRNTQKNAIAAP